MDGFDIRFRIGHYEAWVQSIRPLLSGSPLPDPQASVSRVHSHATYELHCPLCGSYDILAGGERFELREGQLAVIAPDVYHSTLPARNACVTAQRIDFRFSFAHDESVSDADDGDSVVALFSGIDRIAVLKNDFDAVSLLREVNRQLTGRDAGRIVQARCLLCLFLIELSRRLKSNDACVRTMRDARQAVIEEYFSNCFDSEVISPDQLAEKLFLSVRQLNRLLTGLYGMGFREKLAEKRMELARDWLLSSDRSTGEIARLCGFSQESSFCHAFKKRFGCAASRYRLENEKR